MKLEPVKQFCEIFNMGSRYGIATILLAFCSCQNFNYVFSSRAIDRDLQPYVNDFVKYGKKYGYNIDTSNLTAHISYFNQDEKTEDLGRPTIVIGRTYPEFFRGNPYIVILQSNWYAMDRGKREILMAHELGHALLGSDHDNRWIFLNNSALKNSIMAPIVFSGSDFLNNKEYYYKELFTQQVDKQYVQKFLKVYDITN